MTTSPSPDRADGDPVRTLFFGSGAFAVPILDAVHADPGLRIVAVVSTPDRPSGRGGRLRKVPLAIRAEELSLPVIQPATLRDGETAEILADLRPDLGVLADFGRLVPPSILAIPRHGILNVHPSLLPRHRGATPVAGAILAGDRETGVTVMAMDEGLDTGPIVAVERWPLASDATAETEERRSADAGARLLADSLHPWLEGRIIARPQDASAATSTRPLRRSDGLLDPSLAAAELERRVRAFRPWPATFLEAGDTRLTVHAAHVSPSVGDDTPGRLVADADGLALTTVDGRLVLDVVQPSGGRAMTTAELRRGRPRMVGAVVDRRAVVEGGTR